MYFTGTPEVGKYESTQIKAEKAHQDLAEGHYRNSVRGQAEQSELAMARTFAAYCSLGMPLPGNSDSLHRLLVSLA